MASFIASILSTTVSLTKVSDEGHTVSDQVKWVGYTELIPLIIT